MADLSIMNALAVPRTEPPTMSSREIAALTGKEHKNVLRDIRAMLDALTDDGSDLSHVLEEKDGRGYTSCIHLDRELTDTLLTGYSVPLRRRVIARWRELEGQVARPMSQLEVIAASAQHLLMIERQQQAILATQKQNSAEIARIQTQVEEVAHLAASSQVWDHCPQNCEPITKIRGRMLKQYGLPAWVVDMVMRELPLSPKVHGMVRNGHEEAKGMHYEVWAVSDVTRTFRRFVDDCLQETDHFARHPDIDRRFHIKTGLLKNKDKAT